MNFFRASVGCRLQAAVRAARYRYAFSTAVETNGTNIALNLKDVVDQSAVAAGERESPQKSIVPGTYHDETVSAESHRKINAARKDSYELINEMKTLLSNAAISKPDFDLFIKEKLPLCDLISVSNLVRLTGKKSLHNNHLLLRNHLPAIAVRLQEISNSPLSVQRRPWPFMCTGFLIYGMQCLQESDPGVSDIFEIVTKTMKESVKNIDQMNGQVIGMHLLGLQNKKCEQSFTRDYVSIISRCIRQSNFPFNEQVCVVSVFPFILN